MQYYDLGGIDPDKNPKGYLFKKHMGGEESFHIGVFEAYTNPLILKILHIAENCYRFLKE
jgi:lipid II:glycine glycyltransferase (peptidoglycan interpeptide bridge formation enzyme)